MADTNTNISSRFGKLCRSVAVMVIAGVYRSRSAEEINQTLKSRPLRQQTLITASVLALLFGLSLVAAQFGWVGMLIFWLGVVLLVK